MPPSGNCVAVIYTEDEFDEIDKRTKYSPYLKYVEERVTSELEDYMKRQDEFPEVIGFFNGLVLPNYIEMAKSSNIHAFFREIKKLRDKMMKEANQTSITLNMNGNYHKNTFSKKNAFRYPKPLSERKEEIPVFVIDTDGMNAEKLSQYISKACGGRNKFVRLLDIHAGAFGNLFETLLKGGYKGKFGVIFQADNLETLEFKGYQPDANLGEYTLHRQNMDQTYNLVKQARVAVKNPKFSGRGVNQYWGKSPQRPKSWYHEKSVNDSISSLKQKNKASLTDRQAPKLYDAIVESGLYDEFTSSVYLDKKALNPRRELVILRKEVNPVRSGLRLEHFHFYEIKG